MSQQPITITILNDDVDDDIVKALRDMEKEIKEAIIESIYGPPRDKINPASPAVGSTADELTEEDQQN